MILITYALMLVFSVGVYPILDEPFLMARGMYGLGIFVTLICVGSTVAIKKQQKSSALASCTRIVSWIAVFAISWLCVVFCSTYGNCLAEQNKYDEFRIGEVAQSLSEIPQIMNEEMPQLQIVGNVGYAAGIGDTPCDDVLLRLMVPPFGEENYWSYLRLLSYYGLPSINYTQELTDEDYTLWEIADDNSYHTIYVNSNNIVVVLH